MSISSQTFELIFLMKIR